MQRLKLRSPLVAVHTSRITDIGKSFDLPISENQSNHQYRIFALPISVFHFGLPISVNHFELPISANHIPISENSWFTNIGISNWFIDIGDYFPKSVIRFTEFDNSIFGYRKLFTDIRKCTRNVHLTSYRCMGFTLMYLVPYMLYIFQCD